MKHPQCAKELCDGGDGDGNDGGRGSRDLAVNMTLISWQKQKSVVVRKHRALAQFFDCC